jgi:hypothetical protein
VSKILLSHFLAVLQTIGGALIVSSAPAFQADAVLSSDYYRRTGSQQFEKAGCMQGIS